MIIQHTVRIDVKDEAEAVEAREYADNMIFLHTGLKELVRAHQKYNPLLTPTVKKFTRFGK